MGKLIWKTIGIMRLPEWNGTAIRRDSILDKLIMLNPIKFGFYENIRIGAQIHGRFYLCNPHMLPRRPK
jgi:hypothetical protein